MDQITQPSPAKLQHCLLFDWGDTLMRTFPAYNGPMAEWPRIETLPYAHRTLQELHPEWILALATNAKDSCDEDIRTALGRARLAHLLDRIYCYTKVGFKKPSQEFFNYILKDLSLTASAIIMIGDNYETDVVGANQAGIRAVWFNYRSNATPTTTMLRTIHSLKDLPAALKSFEDPLS
ncbi:MAG: HAD family hydrolase [Anaerolineales bacterium]|nr:HAD family hydrolase [Anaerolineales bacterium]